MDIKSIEELIPSKDIQLSIINNRLTNYKVIFEFVDNPTKDLEKTYTITDIDLSDIENKSILNKKIENTLKKLCDNMSFFNNNLYTGKLFIFTSDSFLKVTTTNNQTYIFGSIYFYI